MFKKLVKVKIKDIVIPKCVVWGESHIEMTEEIISNYGNNGKYIIVDKNNKIVDGNHRFCILYKEFDGDHEILVNRILLPKKLYDVIIILGLPILLPIIIVDNLIKNARLKKNS